MTAPSFSPVHDPAAPVLQVLGSVGIQNATGPVPRSISSSGVVSDHSHKATALALLLAFTGPCTLDQISHLIYGGSRKADSTLHSLVSRTRTWLGNNPTNGQPWLTGKNPYALASCTTDWHQAQRHLTPGPLHQSTPTQLAAFLTAIPGEPFPLTQRLRRSYTWAEQLELDITNTVTSASHFLTQAALTHTQHHELALQTLTHLTKTWPTNQQIWTHYLQLASSEKAPDLQICLPETAARQCSPVLASATGEQRKGP